jgi:hypothetical protein
VVLLLLWSDNVGNLFLEVVERGSGLGVVSVGSGVVSFGTGRLGRVWLDVRSGPTR